MGSDNSCYRIQQLWVQLQSPPVQVNEGVCLSSTILQQAFTPDCAGITTYT